MPLQPGDTKKLEGAEAEAVVRILKSIAPWMSREEIISTWNDMNMSDEELEELVDEARDNGFDINEEEARQVCESLKFPDDK